MASLRDTVFVAGGQPTYTYVNRSAENLEAEFTRAVATPNQIVSLAGPTKTGKTVLCRRVLADRQYVWIDGGRTNSGSDFWRSVAHKLKLPSSTQSASEKETEVGAKVSTIITVGGSRLTRSSESETRDVDSQADAISYMIQCGIILVIDDFHYIPADARTELMRNIKQAIFDGLKVVLLSVTHRVFDAIKAESELTGRFVAISLPHWTTSELAKIPAQGFEVLKVDRADQIIQIFCDEAQESPFLMQKFCWEMCFDLKIGEGESTAPYAIPEGYDPTNMFQRLSRDAGLPIYQKLVAGPQSRRVRTKRPLRGGGDADIYQAILLALAETGPKAVVSYDELRESLNKIIQERVPQKHEITSALKHLVRISQNISKGSVVDWDEDKREVILVDPYLRFYLRWRVRRNQFLSMRSVPYGPSA